MYVRLNVKLAEVVEGVDLSRDAEGDVIELEDSQAKLLIMGGWAEQIPEESQVKIIRPLPPSVAADRSS